MRSNCALIGDQLPMKKPAMPRPGGLRRLQFPICGGMAEWLKAHAWKACIREIVSWVPCRGYLSFGRRKFFSPFRDFARIQQ